MVKDIPVFRPLISFDKIDSLGFALRRDFQGHLCENCYQKFLKEFLGKGE